MLADGSNNLLALYKSLSASDSAGALPAGANSGGWDVQVYDRNGDQMHDDSRQAHGDDAGRVPVVAYGYTLAIQRSDDGR